MHRSLLSVGVFAMLCISAFPARSAEQNEELARKLINSQGCKACHSLEGDGGTAAGSFEDMRAKLSRTEILRQLDNPSRKHGKETIPDFSHLTKMEREALILFIQPDSLK